MVRGMDEVDVEETGIHSNHYQGCIEAVHGGGLGCSASREIG